MVEQKLGSFLKTVSNWYWDEFVKAETNPQFTTNQSVVFGLIRACSMQKMDAIRLALNRIDGKLVTPIRVEYPKIFYLFPNAKQTVSKEMPIVDGSGKETGKGRILTPVKGELIPAEEPKPYEETDLPSLTLRQTLAEMADYPRELPQQIVDLALQAHQWVQGHGPKPNPMPHVKSVVAANLLIMAQNRNMEALYEVFDQIDGKLAETIKLIGEDVYIVSYSLTAPDGAYLNDDGILQLEAEAAQKIWEQKLGG